MGRRWLLSAVLTVGLGLSDAHAYPAEHLTEARAALLSEDKRAASKALEATRDAFSSSEGVAADDVLATYWVYTGLLAHMKNKSDAAMDAFREALVVDPRYAWDTEMLDDREIRKLFEALRGEVEGRAVISPRVPEKTGCAQVYIDGSRVRAGDSVGVGERLGQIQCPHGDVYGLWTQLDEEEPIDWLGLCPYPVDTSIDADANTEAEDEFANVGPSFGKEEESGSNPCLDIMATPPPAVVETSEPTKKKDGSSPLAMFGADTWSTPRLVTIGPGGALIVAGVVVHFTAVQPAYDMVEWGRRNPTGLTRYQADILSDRFRSRRALSWSMTGAGVAATAVGLFVLKPKKTGVQPVLFPGGGGLQGRF